MFIYPLFLNSLESGVGQSGYRLQYPSRGACLIQDDLTLSAIVTAREAVSRYDQNGWIEDLPSMQQLRFRVVKIIECCTD